jgi:hypothetical protein
MSHVPVRYLDQLNRLSWRVRLLWQAIEEHDAEAAMRLQRIEEKLDHVAMAINRHGAAREEYLRAAS